MHMSPSCISTGGLKNRGGGGHLIGELCKSLGCLLEDILATSDIKWLGMFIYATVNYEEV